MSNIHRWSRADEVYIEANFAKMSLVELGEHFGVSSTCVRDKCLKMGLRSIRKGPQAKMWSDEEVAYLREHYPVESATDLADYLGVSYTTVRVKALELGLTKAPGYSKSQFRNRYVGRYISERYKNYKQVI